MIFSFALSIPAQTTDRDDGGRTKKQKVSDILKVAKNNKLAVCGRGFTTSGGGRFYHSVLEGSGFT